MSLYSSILGLSARLMTNNFQYLQRTENFSRFRESKTEFLETSYQINECLITPHVANTNKEREGSTNLHGGSIMIHAQKFIDVGLIDSNGKLLVNPNTDHILINGNRFEVTEVEYAGWDWVLKKFILINLNYRQFLTSN